MTTGLLEEFGLAPDELDAIEVPGFDVPDDFYEFVIGDVFLKLGTDNYPDRKWLVFSYLLGDTGKTKDEWFEVPNETEGMTDRIKKSLGWYKARLLSLGFEAEEVNSVGRDDIVGLSGSFKLVTTKDKKSIDRQNIRNFKVNDEEPEPTPAPKSVTRRAPRAAAPKAAPAAVVEEAPAEEAPADDEPAAAEETVAETPVARPVRRAAASVPAAAKASGRVSNPFV